jgi:hypothetical protein
VEAGREISRYDRSAKRQCKQLIIRCSLETYIWCCNRQAYSRPPPTTYLLTNMNWAPKHDFNLIARDFEEANLPLLQEPAELIKINNTQFFTSPIYRTRYLRAERWGLIDGTIAGDCRIWCRGSSSFFSPCLLLPFVVSHLAPNTPAKFNFSCTVDNARTRFTATFLGLAS